MVDLHFQQIYLLPQLAVLLQFLEFVSELVDLPDDILAVLLLQNEALVDLQQKFGCLYLLALLHQDGQLTVDLEQTPVLAVFGGIADEYIHQLRRYLALLLHVDDFSKVLALDLVEDPLEMHYYFVSNGRLAIDVAASSTAAFPIPATALHLVEAGSDEGVVVVLLRHEDQQFGVVAVLAVEFLDEVCQEHYLADAIQDLQVRVFELWRDHFELPQHLDDLTDRLF